MRLTPTSTLPCGCPAMRNTRVLLDGQEQRDVREVDTDAKPERGLVVKYLRTEAGKLRIIGRGAMRQVEEVILSGIVEVHCRTHGKQEG
jgi:hypothetical protein